MKINYSWLKEYIDVKKPVGETAELLTKSGSEVKAVEKIGDDLVMDIEITPNRSDCLSYVGIARELAALTGKEIKMPPMRIREKISKEAPFTVEIKDKDLCPRYTARLIRNVKVAKSPAWLEKKIISMGLRPVNNVVDITNYVLFELGQPMHAFDYDKIEGSAVIIRRAVPSEKIVSIDQTERMLDKDMLVIADREKTIAIGGVIGGLDTEVAGNTKNVLLESAYFNPVSVRKTSFKLSLMSESSYRFERGVDPGTVLPASERTALLMADICGGEICGLVDIGRKPEKAKTIILRMDELNKVLNTGLKESYAKKILTLLGLKAMRAKKGIIKAEIPAFRADLKDEIDLVEEIARVYGYDKIKLTIPKIVSSSVKKSVSWKAREKAKDVLTSAGLNEIVTYGLIGRQALNRVFKRIENAIAVKNPLSAEQEFMRPSLVPGALGALRYNVNRGIKDLKIFEAGAVYYKGSLKSYCERMSLCMALTGLSSNDWQRAKEEVTFFDLKGILEALFRELGLKDFTLKENHNPIMTKGASSEILYEGTAIGSAGSLAAFILDAFDLKQDVFAAEIDFDALLNSVDLEKKFTDIPKYPSVKRDISLIAGGEVSFENITSLIKEEGGRLVEKIELFDRYKGAQIPRGHHGLSVRIEYRDKDKTLAAEEVEKIHSAIRTSLENKLKVTLR